jgi:pimeloyl-ACP methyl ester carboxylesterase
MAGLIAFTEVQAHPERVRGLAVIDGSPRAGMKIPEQQQQFFFQMMETSYDDVLRRMIRGQARDTVEAQELLATAQGVPPASVKAYIKAAMNADASGAFKGMKPAFLFIASERRWPRDRFWVALSKDIGYDTLDSTTIRRVPNSGTLIMKEQPDSLAAIVDTFAAKAIAKK